MVLQSFKMKCYKLFYIFLYVLCASGSLAEDVFQWSIRSKLNLQNVPDDRAYEDEFFIASDKSRDKRALGLILSGLAQVFGYTVNPVQVGSLPNPNGPPTNGAANQPPNNPAPPLPPNSPRQSPANAPAPSSPTSAPPTSPTATAAPRQQETIRFTGVVNFGNNSDILGHLQQYESIFHGGSTAGASTTTTAAPATSTAASVFSGDPRTNGKSPASPPLLVRIPVPLVPDVPPPLSTDENLELSYPGTNNPPRREQQTVVRNNENKEELVIENKEIHSEKDVRLPPDRYTHNMYVDEPHWRKQHEDRIAELERKQEEQAERLRKQESVRSHAKDSDEDYSDEQFEPNYKKQQGQSITRGQESDTRGKDDYSSEEEDDNSNERNYSDKKSGVQSPYKSTTESQGGEREGTEKYRDYENSSSYKPYAQYEDVGDLPPATFSNYTGVPYDRQLPISDYYEKHKPEELRNSYGEALRNHKLIDEGIADYFERFKQPQGEFYDSIRHQNSQRTRDQDENEEDEEEEEEERVSIPQVSVQSNIGRLREEYQLPTKENKYEEYEIRDEKGTPKEDERTSNVSDDVDDSVEVSRNSYKQQSTSEQDDIANLRTPTESLGKIESNREEQSNSEEKKQPEEFDFKYMPYIVPVRYLYAPDELEKTRAKLSEPERVDAFNQVPNNGVGVTSKEARGSKEEELKPKIGLPERLTARKLHEGESKELQMWPPPFDYVFDSTKQANVRPVNARHYTNGINSNAYQKLDPSGRENAAEVGNPTGRFNGYTKSVYYPAGESVESRKSSGEYIQERPKLPIDAGSNYMYPASKNANTNWELRQHEEGPDPLRHYRYEFDNRYRNTEDQRNPHLTSHVYDAKKQMHGQQYLLKPGPLNEDNRKIRPTTDNYYYQAHIQDSQRKPEEPKNIESTKNILAQKIHPPTAFDNARGTHDFFGLSRKDYDFDKEGTNPKSSHATESKSAIEDEVIGLFPPEPAPYQYDESLTKFTSEPESGSEKVKIRQYANRIASVRASEQKHSDPNGPIRYETFARSL